MPLLMVNAIDEHLRYDTEALDRTLSALPQGAPVIICVHGYRFSPHDDRFTPHKHILSLDPRGDCWKAMSWPKHLGFSGKTDNEGLCIAFGWNARGSIWSAYDHAAAAARALATLIARIARPVHLIGHSLGARVALQALGATERGAIDRIILLAAAEFRDTASGILASRAAGKTEIFNITSRENDLFDAMLEIGLRGPLSRQRTIGAGLGKEHARWIDIQIDDDASLDALDTLGFTIARTHRRISHWSHYLRPGVFGLYSTLLRAPERLPIAVLKACLPDAPAPRWSRLAPKVGALVPLSFRVKATSL